MPPGASQPSPLAVTGPGLLRSTLTDHVAVLECPGASVAVTVATVVPSASELLLNAKPGAVLDGHGLLRVPVHESVRVSVAPIPASLTLLTPSPLLVAVSVAVSLTPPGTHPEATAALLCDVAIDGGVVSSI